MEAILVYPAYFPSVLQMAAMAQAHTVVLEICDNYQKQTFRNRAHIAHTNGLLSLNVPVKHTGGDGRQRTSDVQTETAFPWQSQHWKSLQSAYRTSPFFEYYEDELAPLFEQEALGLQAHNLKILKVLTALLDLDLSISLSEQYHKEPIQKDLRNLILAKGGRSVNMPAYHQVFEDRHGFLPNLSVLDLLFNEGPNSLDYLLRIDLSDL